MTQDNGMDVSPSWSELRAALDDLQRAERTYRQKYDTYGHNSLATGQARDKLRSAGHRARQLLRETRIPPGQTG